MTPREQAALQIAPDVFRQAVSLMSTFADSDPWDRFGYVMPYVGRPIQRAFDLADALFDLALTDHRALLQDPIAVHLNMLRGGIAKPTPAQIGHLYRGHDAQRVVDELTRQNPEAFTTAGGANDL